MVVEETVAVEGIESDLLQGKLVVVEIVVVFHFVQGIEEQLVIVAVEARQVVEVKLVLLGIPVKLLVLL